MLNKRLKTAKKVLDIIEDNNHKAYFVGGAIRDRLLNRENGDIDIATSASPQQIQRLFEKVIPVGIEHGTVVVRIEGESFEVTTFRIEGAYSDYRHPDHVQFVDRIEDDLARRDFTINAIAMDKHGNYFDPFCGREDIKHSLIRTVGDPNQRFYEDPLRMLRALRFSSQLGFEIEKTTFLGLKNNIAWIEKIAIERITVELEKMFSGSYLSYALPLFIEAKVDQHLPLLSQHKSAGAYLEQHKTSLCSLSEVIAMLHLLEQDIAINQWIKEWKLSNRIKKEAIQLVEAVMRLQQEGLTKWLVYCLPLHLQDGFVRLAKIFHNESAISLQALNSIYQNLPIHSRNELGLNGEDIVRCHPDRRKGPWINELLSILEYNVVMGNIKNTNIALRELVEKWNPPENN